MKAKNTFIDYLEERLYQWSDWYIRGNFYGLGYPSCSIEYRIMTEGIMSRNPYFKPLPTNQSAEEMEQLVKEMAEYNQLMANVLRCQYFRIGSLRTKAAYLKISHTHFKHYLDMGHQWLAGRLSHVNSPHTSRLN